MTEPPAGAGWPFTAAHRVRSYHAAVLDVPRVILRNPALRRIEAAFALFTSSEWATWVAMIVFAYGNGGATEAGIVSALQLVPATFLAPLAASVAERRRPGGALLATYALQAGACAAGGLALVSGLPNGAIYALLIPASVSFTLTRPLHSTFAPGLARSPDELTATNVLSGWIVGASLFVAPAIAGVLLGLASSAAVFFVMAGACGAAATLVAPLRGRVAAPVPDRRHGESSLSAGLHTVAHDRSARLLVALLAAQGILLGALDVMYVELSQAVLGRGGSWAGYLNAAFGAGGVLAILATARLVGRPRMGPPLAISVCLSSAAFLVIAVSPGVGTVVSMLVLLGGALSVFDVTARTLLQRAAPANVLGRVFGLVEGLQAGAIASGALVAASLIAIGGAGSCAVGLAIVLPLAAALSGRRLLEIDRHATVPIVEIGLLRSMSLFATLPPPTLESVARAMRPSELPAGAVVIRQGEVGDDFYAIADGSVAVMRDGAQVATLARGDGFGELALLLDRPRNATVTTLTRARLYSLSREEFVPAVTGHPRAAQATAELVRARLEPGAPLPDGSPL
jgi:cyclic nucleotide-binding protein/MFS transporter